MLRALLGRSHWKPYNPTILRAFQGGDNEADHHCCNLGRCLSLSFVGNGEILAMLNYESKSPDALKAFRSPVPGQTRQEGIAIIDVDPASPNFKKVVETIALPPDLVAHHIFYNRDMSKAYVTALGKPELRVIDMSKRPFTAKTVAVPDCQVGEDVVFSEDNKRWFLTCMGSASVIAGDAVTDQPTQTIKLPVPYPHGAAIHDGIDRVLVTSTVRATDLGDAGETNHCNRSKHRKGAFLPQGLEQSLAFRRSAGRNPVRAAVEPSGGLRHQHVRRRRCGRRRGTRRRRTSTSLRRTTLRPSSPAFPLRYTLTARPTASTSRRPSRDTCIFSISAKMRRSRSS